MFYPPLDIVGYNYSCGIPALTVTVTLPSVICTVIPLVQLLGFIERGSLNYYPRLRSARYTTNKLSKKSFGGGMSY